MRPPDDIVLRIRAEYSDLEKLNSASREVKDTLKSGSEEAKRAAQQTSEAQRDAAAAFALAKTQVTQLDVELRKGNITFRQFQLGIEEVMRSVYRFTNDATPQMVTALNKHIYLAGQHASNGFKSMSDSLNRINPMMISMSQGFQDAGMFAQGFGVGIRSVTNNIQMLGQQILFARTTGMTLTQILSGMASSLTGPMGLLIGFSLVTAAIQYFADSTSKAKDEVGDFEDTVVRLVESLHRLGKVTDEQMIRLFELENQKLRSQMSVTETKTDMRFVPNVGVVASRYDQLTLSKEERDKLFLQISENEEKIKAIRDRNAKAELKNSKDVARENEKRYKDEIDLIDKRRKAGHLSDQEAVSRLRALQMTVDEEEKFLDLELKIQGIFKETAQEIIKRDKEYERAADEQFRIIKARADVSVDEGGFAPEKAIQAYESLLDGLEFGELYWKVKKEIDKLKAEIAKSSKGDVRESLADLDAQVEELKYNFQVGTITAERYRESLLSIADAYDSLGDPKKAISVRRLAAAVRTLGDAMADSLFLDPIISSFDKLNSAIDATKEGFGLAEITFNNFANSVATGIAQMLVKMMQMAVVSKMLDVFSLGGLVGVPGGGMTAIFSSLMGFRASGGSVAPNSLYVVGERGPEILATGSNSGYVFPNSEFNRMAQGTRFADGYDADLVNEMRSMNAFFTKGGFRIADDAIVYANKRGMQRRKGRTI